MTKKIFLIIVFFAISHFTFAQLLYKNELKTVEGVEIKYRFANTNFFDKSSPQSLRLKLKNTNDYDVSVRFEIVYILELTNKYSSGSILVCIPKKSAKTGKMHGLYFEVLVDKIEDFDKEENWWEFETFEVEKIESCKEF